MPDKKYSHVLARTQGREEWDDSRYKGKKRTLARLQPLPGDVHAMYETGGIRPVIAQAKANGEEQEDRFFLSETHNRLPESVPYFMDEVFAFMHLAVRKHLKTEGGSTANVVYISADPDHTVTVANVGGSRAVAMIRDVISGKVHVERLSRDHSHQHENEVTRLRQLGLMNEHGLIGYKYPAMQRGFSDGVILGIIDTPEITQIQTGPWMQDGHHEVYIVSASNGLFNKLHEADLAALMQRYLKKGSADGRETALAKLFSDTAIHLNTDDVTIQATKLEPKQTLDVAVGIFDGFGPCKAGAATSEILSWELERVLSSERNAPEIPISVVDVLPADASWDVRPVNSQSSEISYRQKLSSETAAVHLRRR